MDILLIYILMLIIPLIASINIKSTYKKYKKVDSGISMSGAEAARTILDRNGLNNVYVIEVHGELNDCYDPTRKVVKLSSDVFHGTNLSSLGVAAHECGHAIQDKEGYIWMKIRSSLFPVVNIANKVAYITLLLGFILQVMDFIVLSVGLTGIALIFQLVTLPVEFDASARAEKKLFEYGLVNKKEKDGVKKVLGSAAMTYVAGVLATVLQMLYYLLVAGNGNRRR